MEKFKQHLKKCVVEMLVVLFIFCMVVVWRRHLRMGLLVKCGIPGPTPNFFWGNLKECFSMGNVLYDSLLTTRYGDICGYYLGAKPIILVSDPVLLKRIQVELSQNFRHRPRRVPGGISADPKRKEMLGNLPPEEWKETREVLSKAFTPLKLKEMVPQMIQKVKIFISFITPNAPLDFYPLLQGLALDIIGQTGFGVPCDIQENHEDPLHLAVQSEFSKSPNSLLVKFYLCLPELAWILQPLRVVLHKIQEMLGWTDSSELWELGFLTYQQRTAHNAEERVDILQQLISSQLREHPLRVVANSVLFFETAYETLSSITAFLIHLLTNHTHIQKKVRDELRLVMGGDTELNYSHLKELKYMEQVIKETLRMFPPQTTFIGRSSDQDIFYERKDGSKIRIPKGVHIQAGLYQLHHNPHIWSNPETFEPDRFGPERKGMC